ncbi:MAG: Flp family type IVb pilin [Janthinobacterium lividum]
MSFSNKWVGAKKSIQGFAQDETGATAIEYGLIAGLIAAVIVTAVTNVGSKLIVIFTSIANTI